MNVQIREHIFRAFITHLLVHIHQKETMNRTETAATRNRPFNKLTSVTTFFTGCSIYIDITS